MENIKNVAVAAGAGISGYAYIQEMVGFFTVLIAFLIAVATLIKINIEIARNSREAKAKAKIDELTIQRQKLEIEKLSGDEK